MGQLRNKCVRDFANPSLTFPTILSHHKVEQIEEELALDDEVDDMGVVVSRNWTEWVLSPHNWYYNEETEKPELCGNASGAR